MRKIISPCGFHCIKVNHLGVWFSEQEILKDVNLHMHCGSLNAIIGKNGAGKSTLIRAMRGTSRIREILSFGIPKTDGCRI